MNKVRHDHVFMIEIIVISNLIISNHFQHYEAEFNIVTRPVRILDIGHEPDMVYPPPPPPPGGSFVDLDFLKAQCVKSILLHVSFLAVGALRCNSLLKTLPVKN